MVATSTSSTPKRNDPCPCGSGFKFKKCCFLVDKNDIEVDKGCCPLVSSETTTASDAADIRNVSAPTRPQTNRHQDTSPTSSDDDDTTLRFRVGDRVEALWSNTAGPAVRFRSGTVVAVNYTEKGWLGDVPYQIRLDGPRGHLIYAPYDDDSCVRALEPSKYEGLGSIGKRRRHVVPVSS